MLRTITPRELRAVRWAKIALQQMILWGEGGMYVKADSLDNEVDEVAMAEAKKASLIIEKLLAAYNA